MRFREKETDGLQEEARAEAMAGRSGGQRSDESGHG